MATQIQPHRDDTPASEPGPSNKTTIRISIETNPSHRNGRTTAENPDLYHGDNNSIASEEEIITELNEEALSRLPLNLRNNMRKIQAERVRQWQKDQIQRHSQYLYQLDENSESEFDLVPQPEPEPEPRDNEYSTYAENWFKNMMAKVSATRELEAKRITEKSDDSFGRPQNMTWCPVRQEWVPVYYGEGQEESKPMDGDGDGDRSGGGRARLCGIGGREKTRLSQANTAVAEEYCLRPRRGSRLSPHGGYMSWRCDGPYYVYDTRGGQVCRQHEEQPSKRLSSFVSAIRNGVCAKVQPVKKIFKK
ncbi:hypothetical protein BDW62DRAFT_218512 [Aspergillus aurantiobrunneus]